MPLLAFGSISVPESSLRRSEARISAAAGTGASILNFTREGDGFGAMSGTSKMKSEMLILRPAGVSATPCAIVTVAVRPVTRAFRSASWTDGISSTGRTVTPDATMLTARPSSGIGGPLRDRLRTGELTPTSMRWSVPRLDPLDHPFAHLGHDQDRPDPLQRGGRHRRSRKAELQPRLARIVDAAGAGDADLAIADIGLGQQYALLVGVEAHADRDAVEDQRLFALDAGQHDGAAAKARPASP